MKRLAVLLIVALCLCGCSAQDYTGTITTGTELKTVSDYFDLYEVLMDVECENGYVYRFDDGSEYGLAVAISLTKKQMKKISGLDFFSETYNEDKIAIVEKSKKFTVTSLDECIPDLSDYDQYIGQKVEALMNDGFSETGNCISDSLSFLMMDNNTYCLNVYVEESLSIDQDMTEEFEKTLTIMSFEFSGWGYDFYEGLFN